MPSKTKAGSIMELACLVAGEDVSGRYGKTVTDAVDALNDALSGGDARRGRTVSDGLGALLGSTARVMDQVGALKAALGVAGPGPLADVLAAAAGAVASGGAPDAEIATDEEVRLQLHAKENR